ncbi:MAG: MBL fold metallo-hydrolase [Candidatus Omnitrophica bacterium]|nr:MBL fold metallo-hydrolase [Candidatus Omnitrophota bacterium]
MKNFVVPAEVFFEQIPIGPMANFAYLIGDRHSGEVALVDPGWEIPRLLDMIKQKKCFLTAVLLTHGHYDHIDGLAELLDDQDVPVYISRADADFFKVQAGHLVKTVDGDNIKIGGIELECIAAPGHTPGCQLYRYKNILLTGDVLFFDACGRCDLPGSDPAAMETTLRKIKQFPDDTLIFSGHGYGRKSWDTLANQKKTNPFL